MTLINLLKKLWNIHPIYWTLAVSWLLCTVESCCSLIPIDLRMHGNAYFSMTLHRGIMQTHRARKVRGLLFAFAGLSRGAIFCLATSGAWLRIQGSHSTDSFVSHSRPGSTKWAHIKARPSTRRFFLVGVADVVVVQHRGGRPTYVFIWMCTCVRVHRRTYIFSWSGKQYAKRGFIRAEARGNNLRAKRCLFHGISLPAPDVSSTLNKDTTEMGSHFFLASFPKRHQWSGACSSLLYRDNAASSRRFG